MTRHQTSSTPGLLKSGQPKPSQPTLGQQEQDSLLQPLRPVRNLTDEVVERIAGQIRSGRLVAGAQLPTEVALMAALGVSRTVVREAVSALRAEGLVVTRQGLGAFVSKDASRVAFRIASHAADDATGIAEVLHLMELRLSVETEAAALAAERATTAQLARIDDAVRAIDTAIAAERLAVQEDIAFHRAIAEATGNPHFPNFLAFLGRHVLPRQVIRNNGIGRPDLILIQREHVAIAIEIAAGHANGARRAMRLHLSRSIDRYRQMANGRLTQDV